jgi:WD40 repeat protein
MNSVEQTPTVRIRWTADLADGVQDLAWSPDGRYPACGCQDNKLRDWTWPEAQDFQMSGYLTKVRVLTWDRASRWLATADREIVTVWDFAQGPPWGARPWI